MTTFLLVAGAWHGGWCWRRVTPLIRTDGHDVVAVTLTGLGDRSHLLSPDIGLRTHVDDVLQTMIFDDLHDVVLVGHSYGGFVVREAADRMPERVRKIVLVDGWGGNDGESMNDRAPEWFREACRQSVEELGEGWRMPPPPAALMGVSDPSDAAWLESRLTPHPWRSFCEPTELTGAVDGIPCLEICSQPGVGIPFDQWATEFGWEHVMLETGHDAMVVTPTELNSLLQAGASCQPEPPTVPERSAPS